MAGSGGAAKRFTAVLRVERGRGVMDLPFDPDEAWGTKPRHHVGGTLGGHRFRAVIEPGSDGHVLTVGAMWLRDCPVEPGTKVKVELTPEGPQRDDLAEDLAAALDADPVAGAFWDGLAQFYRKAYLSWIDATKRSPELRAERIAATVGLLHDGVKERPKGPAKPR
jgi:hypothetical protein